MINSESIIKLNYMKSKINFYITHIFIILITLISSTLTSKADLACYENILAKQIDEIEKSLNSISSNEKGKAAYSIYKYYTKSDIYLIGLSFPNEINKIKKECGLDNKIGEFDMKYGNGFLEKESALDYEKANYYLEQADNMNYPPAVADNAKSYLTGKGKPRNIEIALKKALRAAKLGSQEGQLLAGGMLANLDWYDKDGVYNTKGVSINLVLSYMWLNIAASSDVNAKRIRDEVAKRMNASEINEAEKLSTECVKSNLTNCEKSWW